MRCFPKKQAPVAAPVWPEVSSGSKTTPVFLRYFNGTGSGKGLSALAQLTHRYGGVGHAVRESPLVVVPAQHAHQRTVHDLGLVHVEGRRVAVMVEVDRHVGLIGPAQDAFELVGGGELNRLVDLVLVGLALGDELEVDER